MHAGGRQKSKGDFHLASFSFRLYSRLNPMKSLIYKSSVVHLTLVVVRC